MGTVAEIFGYSRRVHKSVARSKTVATPLSESTWSPEGFEDEQVRALVQRVFVTRSGQELRQVVFSSVSDVTGSSLVCSRVARTMAAHMSGKVCAVEASPNSTALEEDLVSRTLWPRQSGSSDKAAMLRVSDNLWLSQAGRLCRNDEPLPLDSLKAQLSEIKKEFEYSVIHALPAGAHSDAALLGSMCDGVILIVDAQRTRRAEALKAQDLLQGANARLLGTVLTERQFPIPEMIYRRI